MHVQSKRQFHEAYFTYPFGDHGIKKNMRSDIERGSKYCKVRKRTDKI